jgi:uncharacterized membrane protein YhaH (DUF805 family)
MVGEAVRGSARRGFWVAWLVTTALIVAVLICRLMEVPEVLGGLYDTAGSLWLWLLMAVACVPGAALATRRRTRPIGMGVIAGAVTGVAVCVGGLFLFVVLLGLD